MVSYTKSGAHSFVRAVFSKEQNEITMGVGQDYKVSRRDQREIASMAMVWRAADPANASSNSFDVTDLLQNHVLPRLAKEARHFLLQIDEDDPGDPLGWVDFDRGIVCFQKAIWTAAQHGDPLGRLVVAHEIGHLLLHRYQTTAFSAGLSKKLNFVAPEESAEQQANWFAASLLVPDHVMFRLGHLEDETIAILTLTTAKLVSVRRRECETITLTADELCPRCGSISVVHLADNTLCVNCGDWGVAPTKFPHKPVENSNFEGFPR